MKNEAFTVIFTLAVCLTAATDVAATPVTLSAASSQYYLGYVTPPQPSSLAAEVLYVNTLVGLVPIASGDQRDYVLNGTLVGPFGEALLAGALRVEIPSGNWQNPALGIDVTGFGYLLAKYGGPGGGSVVWLVNGLSTVYLPPSWGPNGKQYGISHYSLFIDPPSPSVPDGGATVTLLAGALACLATLRVKRSA